MKLRHISLAGGALIALLTVAGCAPTSSAENSKFVDTVYETTHRDDEQVYAERKAREKALIDLAGDEGITRRFSVNHLLSQDQGKRLSEGDEMAIWNAYNEHLKQLETQLREKFRNDVTLDEVRDYYEQNRNQFQRQDQIKAQVIPWEKGRARAAFELDVNAENVKAVEEHFGELIATMNQMVLGERQVVELPDGRTFEVEILSRIDGGIYEFEDVVQAATFQLVDKRIEQELSNGER